MSTTKKDIIKRIAEKVGEPQTRTREIVRLTLEAVLETAMEEGRVELRDFGVFEVKHRKARKARNPKTGENIQVPATAVLTFKAGKKVRDRAAREAAKSAASA